MRIRVKVGGTLTNPPSEARRWIKTRVRTFRRMDAHWEHFAHDADMGLRGVGRTEEEAFAQAALALTGVITPPETVRPEQVVELSCAAPDRELLLVDWLNAVIFEMATRHLVFGRYEVRFEGNRLTARCFGEPVDQLRHERAVEPKGATFTALEVDHRPTGEVVAQCVVDV